MNLEIGVITHSFLKNHVVYLFISGCAGSPLLPGSSLAAVRSYSLVVVCRLLIAAPSHCRAWTLGQAAAAAAAAAAALLQSCLTLCNPIDSSLPGSSVHGIFQPRVLEWGAIALGHLK